MKIINIFGGPGVGKSTTAAGLFFDMKREGKNVELVTEYAKDMTWEDRGNILADQLYILAKQHRKIKRLEGKVDFVITDAPLIQGLMYVSPGYFRTFESVVLEIWESYDNHSFYLERGDIEFQQIGRNQDLNGAKEIDDKLMRFLLSRRIQFTSVTAGDGAIPLLKTHLEF